VCRRDEQRGGPAESERAKEIRGRMMARGAGAAASHLHCDLEQHALLHAYHVRRAPEPAPRRIDQQRKALRALEAGADAQAFEGSSVSEQLRVFLVEVPRAICEHRHLPKALPAEQRAPL
jgi:hypothetical protein